MTEAKLYGFEDYKIRNAYGEFLDYSGSNLRFYPYGGYRLMFADNVPAINVDKYCTVTLNYDTLKSHIDLLKTAKKVYIHKSCSISRSLVSSKYKKVLDPWMADIIVVPNPANSVNNGISATKVAAFINDDTKIIIVKTMPTWRDDLKRTESALWNAPIGYKLGDLIPSTTIIENSPSHCLSVDEYLGVRDSTAFYKGYLINFTNKEDYLIDIFTNALPKDKVVFEEDVQSSLASIDNDITLASLLSIYDMVQSNDSDVVNAGIKALAMMDYAHYTNSVKYMLNQTRGQYRWCSAFTSSAVKFMFKTLMKNQRVRRNMYLSQERNIYPQDFELYKQLVEHFDKDDSRTLAEKIRFANFMTVDINGMLVPRLKETA